jgi:hypothetical protein
MDEVAGRKHALTFNGPMEAGVRVVAILGAAFPRTYDLQRLTAFDYLLVNTAKLDGPEDLHPATPINTPATEVRRKVIQQSLHLTMSRDLVQRRIDASGIRYCAGEAAAMFLESLQTPYAQRLKATADWLVHHLADYTDEEFTGLMRRFFDDWVVEFQTAEESLGVDL